MKKDLFHKDNLILYTYAGISLAYFALFVAKFRTLQKAKT